jgi:hypothetical protein
MTRILASIVMAFVAVALRLLWEYEHEHTNIRAPWTGITYAGSALAFVAVGVLGRGWRALAIATAVAATTVLIDHQVWNPEPSTAPRLEGDCDPACIPLEAAVVIAGATAAAPAAFGIALRRAVGRARRSRGARRRAGWGTGTAA